MTSDISTPLEAFDSYSFKSASASEELIFCVKELRALLAISEILETSELLFNFTSTGDPVQFLLQQNNSQQIKLILATLTQASMSAAVAEEPSKVHPEDQEEPPSSEQVIDASATTVRDNSAVLSEETKGNAERKRKQTFLDDTDDE
jgi:hypothetical protein